MEFLIRNAERTLTTEEICRHVWREQQEVSAEAVYLYISYLRQKLKSISSDAEILEQGAGCYVLREKKP